MTQPKHWAAYRRALDDPTSTPEQCEAARQAAWSAEERGTGRTTRMLMQLPVENTPTVVVHTQALCDYVRNLARQLRPDLRHPIRVRIVRDARDCDHLRGLRFVVDHATLEQAGAEVRQLFAMLGRPVR